mgnify:CR=1 FL=1
MQQGDCWEVRRPGNAHVTRVTYPLGGDVEGLDFLQIRSVVHRTPAGLGQGRRGGEAMDEANGLVPAACQQGQAKAVGTQQ